MYKTITQGLYKHENTIQRLSAENRCQYNARWTVNVRRQYECSTVGLTVATTIATIVIAVIIIITIITIRITSPAGGSSPPPASASTEPRGVRRSAQRGARDVHVHVCVYVCVYVYACVCVYVYVCTYVYLYIYIYIYKYMYTSTPSLHHKICVPTGPTLGKSYSIYVYIYIHIYPPWKVLQH